MATIQKKALADASLHELREFVTDIENLSLGEGHVPAKMSKVQLRTRLEELGYHHIYVSTAPPGLTPFNGRAIEIAHAHSQIGLTPKTEIWFLIRIHNDKNLNGKSKNVPVPVQFNDDKGYIPRGVPVWVRGRFIDSLNDAQEWHTIQSDPTQRFSESADRQQQARYPYTVIAVGGLVADGPPPVEEGQQVLANDRSLRMLRQRMDLTFARGTAKQRQAALAATTSAPTG